MSELDLLKRLKPHPNVIRLLGCVTKDVIRRRGKREFSKFVCCVKSTKSITRKLERELFYKFFINFCKLIGELDFFFGPSYKVVGSSLDHVMVFAANRISPPRVYN